MNSLVSPTWLMDYLGDLHLAIIDCRFTLGSPRHGKQAYESEHIPGAIYFDLEKDWSSETGEHGGRHPLPDIDTLAHKLGNAGISRQTRVVLYDDQNGCMAARGYWLLRYLGHEQVALLDGGYSAWKRAGGSVTSEIQTSQPVQYIPNIQTDMVRNMNDVRKAINNPHVVLVDSRALVRYTGETEPIDKVGGHIPGACQYDWQSAVDSDGTWKPDSELQNHFSALPEDKEIIVYCGSGVTACANLFALERAGFRNARLYPGSWSDWITYSDNPVAKGKEK
ncbi:sulfurtransferase [Aneurinibacillus terranovensis]|uniref:sulfurtransferase n=1 Tax=Aneurinibacillus terranovensis TaxID=278991 RepID=UPI0003FBEC9E|nr:sulfurtransferase [Aneurinibacillus terranovensis]